MEKNTIGKFISALRRSAGMTQRELGEKLFVSDKTVSRWERDECTPELNLIPAIADLFGITADELLRGERRSAPEGTETATRQKERSRRQFQHLLERRMTRFRNQSIISAGVAAVGLLAALAGDLAFHKAMLGFLLGLAFLLAATVCQLCFASSARLREEEGEELAGDMAAANHRVSAMSIRVFSLIGLLLVFLLPLLLAGTLYGLDASSWMLLGLLSVAFWLVVGYLLYIFCLRGVLIRRGLLPERDQAGEKKLLKKYLLRAVALCAAFAVGLFALEAIGWTWLVKPTESFDNFQDFRRYMADAAFESERQEWVEDGYTVVHYNGDEGYRVVDRESGETVTVKRFYMETAYDNEGRKLGNYPQATGVSRVEFDVSDGGELSIRVYTEENVETLLTVRTAIQGALVLGMVVSVLECAVAYFKKKKQM